MKVPFVDLTRQHATLASDLSRAVARVLEGAQFVLGPEGAAFEAEFAAYCGVVHAIGVGSGTDALRIALEVLDIGPGDEVIVPAFTFVATAGMVSKLGAVPVFADVDDALNLDAEDVRRCLTPRTRGIIPVHLYGQAAEMGPLRALAEAHGLPLVEDAAQAIGAEWHGRRTGGLGRLACFSFYPTKNLGACGDGGMITTDDDQLAARMKRLRNHGSEAKYVHREPGWCSRLDEVQAAILRIKLRRLDEWIARRRALAAEYCRRLAPLPIVLPAEARGARSVYHLFTIRTDKRDALARFLGDRGIGTAIHYPVPLHQQPLYERVASRRLPAAERAAREVLSLPLFPELRADEQEAVIAAIGEFFSTNG